MCVSLCLGIDPFSDCFHIFAHDVLNLLLLRPITGLYIYTSPDSYPGRHAWRPACLHTVCLNTHSYRADLSYVYCTWCTSCSNWLNIEGGNVENSMGQTERYRFERYEAHITMSRVLKWEKNPNQGRWKEDKGNGAEIKRNEERKKKKKKIVCC